jgi:CP family cyanate transporter-like MFS transporter
VTESDAIAAGEPRPAPAAFPARALVAVLLVAFNMRLAIVSVGPLIERIRADTGMSSAVAGLLTAIPFLCMGLFGLAGIGLARRLGFSRLLLASLALVTVGTALRAWMSDPALLVLTTIPIGVGIALAGVALQGAVKREFGERSGVVTGWYVSVLSVGGAIGALAILPAADGLGGWHEALALTALPAAVATAAWPWVGSALRSGGAEVLRSPSRRPSGTAVVLGLIFGFQGMCFAGMIAWIAAVYEDAGWTPHAAALATASIPVLTIPSSLVFSALSERGDRRYWVAGTAILLTLGLIGIAVAPGTAGWLWLLLFALGIGSIFALLLALALDRAGDPLEGVHISAWMLAIGFTMSAPAPVLIGALRDLTGDFTLGVGALAVLGAAAGVLAIVGLGRSK